MAKIMKLLHAAVVVFSSLAVVVTKVLLEWCLPGFRALHNPEIRNGKTYYRRDILLTILVETLIEVLDIFIKLLPPQH